MVLTWPQIKEWIPEIYLMASVLIYWVMEATLLNPVATSLLLVLLVLMITKNQIFAWVISLLFLLLNLYMVLAMIDELNEFPVFNVKAAELLIGGTLYLGSNIAVALWMMVKWGRKIAAS